MSFTRNGGEQEKLFAGKALKSEAKAYVGVVQIILLNGLR